MSAERYWLADRASDGQRVFADGKHTVRSRPQYIGWADDSLGRYLDCIPTGARVEIERRGSRITSLKVVVR